MATLRTIIVDDEPLALALLRSYLSSIAEIEIVAECKNGKEAIAAAMELSPDLMFLDIQMPGINGFDVIKNLQADMMPLVIFATAYEHYALDAFNVHAVDYILKPIDQERVSRAVERALQRFERVEDDGQKSNIISAITDMTARTAGDSKPVDAEQNIAQENVERRIVVKDGDTITLLKQADIEWIDAAGDYMCLHADGSTHVMRSTLKSLLDQLNPEIFQRVHRSTIVNLNRIERVIPHTKGEYFLELGEHDRIKVSRNYRKVIKGFLSDV